MTQSNEQALEARVQTLEEQVDKLTHALKDESTARRQAEQRVVALEERVDELEEQVEKNKSSISTNAKNGAEGRADLRGRIVELQERELEKDAHLSTENLDPADVSESAEERLGKVQKDGGESYWYLGTEPGSDPVEANEAAKSDPRLSTADLLPIQQLANMDDDTLREHAGTLPDYWAARLWRERGEESSLWKEGSGTVNEYLDASDVATRIYVESDGIGRETSREYARRAFKSLTELSANRVGKKKAKKRSDGLNYKETRAVIHADAEIPGEPRAAAAATDPLEQDAD